MPVTDPTRTCANENFASANCSSRNGRAAVCTRSLISGFLASILLLGLTSGCAPSRNDPKLQSGPSSTDLPELTDDIIRERINDAWIRDVPEETGTGQPISWRFYGNEPKEITVVDKQIDGMHATIILDIKTSSAPRTREPRSLAGQIRTIWELRSGLILRKWEIVDTENISLKYKSFLKPAQNNSNQ